MTTSPEADPAEVTTSRAEDVLVGTRVHKYDIVRVIGRGGMGTVYEAINTAIGKRVAMKFVDSDTARNAEAVARFQREAQAASAVESAHIVEIFDSGTSDDGIPYIVMELLRGEDLGHLIRRCGRLDLSDALHVIAQILRGLDRAHKAGIVHRDLKPDNIFLVDRDDDAAFAKILDFGVSKMSRVGATPLNTLTRKGTVLGTAYYMSPEQAQAQPNIDGRTDLWSVGAILFECLAGRPPHAGGTYEQVIVNICMNDADDVRLHNPTVPEAIAAVIGRALSRDREARFADARSFLDTLRAAAGGLLSSRPGAISMDDIPGLPIADSTATPMASGARTPSQRPAPLLGSGRLSDPGDAALNDMVEGQSKPPIAVRSPALVFSTGTTRRRAAVRRRQRMFILVAVTALLTGGASALLITRTWGPRSVEPSASARASNPTPTGPEAVATAPLPAASTMVPAAPPAEASAPPVTGSAPASSVEGKRIPAKAPHGPVAPNASVKAKPVESAAPSGGVAAGLKLKTD